MNQAAALTRLKVFTQWTVEPGLTGDELDILLEMNRSVDSEGLGPADDGYTPTWTMQDLYRAAAEGWRWKAAKLSHQHAVAVDGQNFAAEQKFGHCEAMARHYAGKVVVSVSVARASVSSSDEFFC